MKSSAVNKIAYAKLRNTKRNASERSDKTRIVKAQVPTWKYFN